MSTRPNSWNDDCKGENSRGILKISDLHTLFTPQNAKSVNFVYNSCHITIIMSPRCQNRNIPCIAIHRCLPPALPIGRRDKNGHDATTRCRMASYAIAWSSWNSAPSGQLHLLRRKEQGSSPVLKGSLGKKIRSYNRRWESAQRPPTCG